MLIFRKDKIILSVLILEFKLGGNQDKLEFLDFSAWYISLHLLKWGAYCVQLLLHMQMIKARYIKYTSMCNVKPVN